MSQPPVATPVLPLLCSKLSIYSSIFCPLGQLKRNFACPISPLYFKGDLELFDKYALSLFEATFARYVQLSCNTFQNIEETYPHQLEKY